jgi:hypothetical protein
MKQVLAGLWLVLAIGGGLAACAQTGPHVEDPGKLPAAPPTVRELAYDSRILSSAAAAEQFQGALDGGWMLSDGQHDLYAVELVDKRDRLEGAWRDPRRKGDPQASGVLDLAQRTPPGLLLRFTPAGQAPVTVTLRPNLQGELEQGGQRTAVTLRKTPAVP